MVGPFHGGAFRNGPANAGYLGIWWTFHRESKYPPTFAHCPAFLTRTDPGDRETGDEMAGMGGSLQRVKEK